MKGGSVQDQTRALLDRVFEDMPDGYRPQVLEERDINWRCDCSRERLAGALAAIGKRDLTEIIEEDGEAELQCHFCLKKYHFDRDELLNILHGAK